MYKINRNLNLASPSRRAFVRSLAGIASLAALPMPAWAMGKMGKATQPLGKGAGTLHGPHIQLSISEGTFRTGDRRGYAIGLNGTIPGPLIRLREGTHVKLEVHNGLSEDSSVHWHGLLLPFQFDGVPGLSFPGIKPHSDFVAEFEVRQSGTYWYHSHSGLQEQLGHYGPIIIDPAGKDPVQYDREHVVLLSEFATMSPHQIMKKLKVAEGYFNRRKLATFDDYDMDASTRRLWSRMRMLPTDIADVSAPTYSYMINGHSAADNLELPFVAGERVRLRFINGSAMTFFNIRIPNLPMTIVQADGQNVRPTEVDEFQIGVAETYDVIVTPRSGAHALVAESMDRSGMARAVLTSQAGAQAAFPKLREPPLLTMVDMGHGSAESGHAGHGEHAGHSGHGGHTAHSEHRARAGHNSGRMRMRDTSLLPSSVEAGHGVDMVAMNPQDRMDFPGLGLDKVAHRVLTYRMLRSLEADRNKRAPERALELHLTGNMERYMWSFDGRQYSAVGDSPIRFAYDERVRVKLVNDTMMAHPIHLHGMFFELVNGQGAHQPKKHTLIVQPGSSAQFDVTTNESGDWAFHCHLLYHMHAGMMQTVSVAFPDSVSG